MSFLSKFLGKTEFTSIPEKTAPVPEEISAPAPRQEQNVHVHRLFALPSSESILLENHEKSIQRFITALQNNQPLRSFLETHADISGMKPLLKQLGRYEQHLTQKLPDLQESRPNAAEYAALTVISLISRELLSKFVSSIINHIIDNQEAVFYKDLLYLLNAYLSGIGFCTWSPQAAPGKKIPAELLPYYDVSTIASSNPAMHGIVAEVQQLPYCLRYQKENGSEDYCFISGTVLIYDKS